jgi:aryl-alcohol dehydrogenase-like predicted oxidoreductase
LAEAAGLSTFEICMDGKTQRREYGVHTDLHVSRVAFGTWSFGGDWGPIQAEDSKQAIRKALELGINFFDSAQAYGFGASERILGEALQSEIKHYRHSVVLATKGGLRGQDGELVRDAMSQRAVD